MATIEHLAANQILEPFEIPDDVDRLPIRRLYLCVELSEWIDGTLVYEKKLKAGRTAYEHLEQFFIDFRCNKSVHGGDLKRVLPTAKGTWKMHPPMLRVYGWVPEPHCFVAICAALEAETKKNKNLNDLCRNKVLDFIQQHKITSVLHGDFLNAFPQTS